MSFSTIHSHRMQRFRGSLELITFLSLSLYAPLISAQVASVESQKEKTSSLIDNLLERVGSDDNLNWITTNNPSKGPAYYSKRTIYVHEGLMEVLAGERAEDALSYVLAHELAHHERNHLCSHFAKKVSATTDWADERSTKEQAIANSKRIETEADTYAGLYGHIAGYRPLDVAEETLDKIYEAYDIPDSLPGYPTLDERKVMAARSREEFNQVAKAYDAAWIALATGEYAAASHLLTTIIVDAEYESPEMHGLLALAQFLDAVKSLNNPKLSQWSWPIQMQRDTNSRTRGMSRDEKEFLLDLLSSALNHAEKANKLNVGKGALELEEEGREETGLEASITWLKKWVMLDGQDDRHNKMMDIIESKKEINEEGFWRNAVAVNLEALTWWMAEKDKKAMKLLSASGPSAANEFNVLAIEETRSGEGYQKLDGCEQVQKLEQEAIPRFSFGSASAEERIVVGGKKVLTLRNPREGVVDLELKQGRSELNFVMLEPSALEHFCWGLSPNVTLAELKDLFQGQRKTLIELNLGSIMCLPDEHLAFQFNATGALSFVALSLN